jgi:hypothetical protein
MNLDLYVPEEMCQQSWVTSCLEREPALRWFFHISQREVHSIQKIKKIEKYAVKVEKKVICHDCHLVARMPLYLELLSLSSLLCEPSP